MLLDTILLLAIGLLSVGATVATLREVALDGYRRRSKTTDLSRRGVGA
ncbi:hypothetical protein ACOKGD_06840 [Microbacterium phosphatis]